MSGVVEQGSRVILQLADGKRIFFYARRGEKFSANKWKRIPCDPIIGHPYGSYFQVQKDGTLIKVDTSQFERASSVKDVNFVPTADNSRLVDDNSAQKLTFQQIESLKGQHDGLEIVEILAQNSATFKDKTEFSQEKYLKKKLKKYVTEIKLVKPTAYSMIAGYFAKKPDRILHMRPDSLALLLSKANLRPNSQVIVIDTCVGLVLSAVMDRLGGQGRVLNGCTGSSGLLPPESIKMFNFSEQVMNSLVCFPMHIVSEVVESLSPDYSKKLCESSEYMFESTTEGWKQTQKITEADLEQIKRWMTDLSDTIVIAAEYDPGQTLKKLLPLLTPGGNFVVYYPTLESLSSLALELRSDRSFINVQLSENFYREYQVLSGRTHPEVQMSAASGYLLSGIKVLDYSPKPTSSLNEETL